MFAGYEPKYECTTTDVTAVHDHGQNLITSWSISVNTVLRGEIVEQQQLDDEDAAVRFRTHNAL